MFRRIISYGLLLSAFCLGTFSVRADDQAQFVTQSVPNVLLPGQRADVSVTMRNSGTTAWTLASGYYLGSQNPENGTSWGMNRAFPGCETVRPPSSDNPGGDKKTFVFTITAPTTPGYYNFQWRMVHEFVNWFGDYSPTVTIQVLSAPPPAQIDDADFVIQSVPTILIAGRSFDVSVRMRNVGSTVWTSRDRYFLGSQSAQDNTVWGFNRAPLDLGDGVRPGQEKTFTFTITAPSMPGSYTFRWRMVRDFVRWFGDVTPNASVQVQTAPQSGAPPVAQWLFDDIWPPQTGPDIPTVDSSGGGGTAYITGTIIMPGPSGYARAFSALTDSIIANSSAALSIPGDLTLEAWVRPTGRNAYSAILNKGPNAGSPAGSPGNYDLGLDSSGYPHFRHQFLGGVRDYAATTSVPLDSWSHLAVAWGSGRVRFYLNAVLVTDLPDNGETAFTNSSSVRIGHRSDSTNFVGAIDEVTIWNYARSAQQIRASYVPQSTCPAANPNDAVADDSALQACLDHGGEIRLKPGYPGYRIASGLHLTLDNVVLTSTSAVNRAVLLAAPSLSHSMLEAGGRAHVAISFIEFNGNRPARDQALCCGPFPPGELHCMDCINVLMAGRTAIAETMTNVAFDDNRSTQALCTSSLWLNGDTVEVARNLFDDNGHGIEARAVGGWSDGLTLGQCINGVIRDNTVVNASDIGIVSGGGPGCAISNNRIMNVEYNGTRRHAFAGLSLGVFCYAGTCTADGTGAVANHTGSVLVGNLISAEGGDQGFGIVLGHHPWNQLDSTVLGAEVFGNAVSGALVGLAVDGVRDVTVGRNALSAGTNGPAWQHRCGVVLFSSAPYTVAHATGSAFSEGWLGRSYDSCIPERVQGALSLAPDAVPVRQAGGSEVVTITISGSGFSPTSVASFDGLAKATTYVTASMLQMELTHEDLKVAGIHQVTVGTATLPLVVFFADVPPGHSAYNPVSLIAYQGITGGIGNNSYGPDLNLTRAQMAVFLLTAKHGAGYNPPPCTGIFVDVPCPGLYRFADYIEQFYREGITAGCSAAPLGYCPDANVLKREAAVFLLRSREPAGYLPPPCTGLFLDVPCPGLYSYADFVEEVSRRGIDTGCSSGHFCPTDPVSRALMAQMVASTWSFQAPY